MTIKDTIRAHLNSGFAICHGHADRMTNSQSGGRRLREIIAENPDMYSFIRVKSKHDGVYNVYFLAKSKKVSFKKSSKGFCVLVKGQRFYSYCTDYYESKKLAKQQIKKVVR